jgi:NTE family protein
MSSRAHSEQTALVLSGGGARGAYAVGVVSGLVELLGSLHARFQTFTGTSVGAINAAYLAANARLCDLGVSQLINHYTDLRLDTHLRPSFSGWLRFLHPRSALGAVERNRRGAWLLDPSPFERIVTEAIAWDALHDNIDHGLVRSLIVSGLRVADGRTTTFAELAPGTHFVRSRDPRRDALTVRLTADHVLASAALPFLFPARRIGNDDYCDGGLRFNTPIAPAIRTGATRLVIIALRSGTTSEAREKSDATIERFKSPFFLLGKVFDALLLDPIEYDLHVLDRLNRIVDIVHQTMMPSDIARLEHVLSSDRGLPYGRLDTLVFRPSQDLGVLAGEHVHSDDPTLRENLATRFFLRRAAALGEDVEADLVSYLLFDGGFAKRLIALGRKDALDRAEEVRAFFARDRGHD